MKGKKKNKLHEPCVKLGVHGFLVPPENGANPWRVVTKAIRGFEYRIVASRLLPTSLAHGQAYGGRTY